MKLNRNVVIAAAAVVVIGGGAGGFFFWRQYEASLLPAGIVATNGRVEATQVDISIKIPGRVVEITPHEGDMVSPGEVLARIDTSENGAQLDQAKAAAELARQTVATRQAEVASDEAQEAFANEEMRRAATLVEKGWSTHETYDQRTQQLRSAQAALKAAKSQVDESLASVKTADAKVEELQAVVDDSAIRSPVRGRVQYRLVEPGAVLPPGGKILTVIDLSDVYTTVFSPRRWRGGSKSATRRAWWWTPDPEYVFPATVSFVAPESQFTPKTVEVQSEREQLYFRVKLQAPLQLLKGIEDQVKAGLRGMGYVRIDPAVEVACQAGGQFAAHGSGRPIGCRDDDCAHRNGKAAEGPPPSPPRSKASRIATARPSRSIT